MSPGTIGSGAATGFSVPARQRGDCPIARRHRHSPTVAVIAEPSGPGRVRLRDLRRLLKAVATLATSVGRGVANRRTTGRPLAATVTAEVRIGFEKLGPTYVKLGQMVASTPAMFPDVLVEGFAGCLDDVAPLPSAVVHEVVIREFGAPAAEVFTTFDDRPLASASIAQVHRATLDDGTDVVVKVQRPGIADHIAADLRIMHLGARVAEKVSAVARLAQPVAIVEDFAATLDEELNFMVEARSMETVAASVADFAGADGVVVPVVVWRCTTPRALTMRYIDGVRLDDIAGMAERGVDPEVVLKRAVRAWLHTTLVHGVFHGDLHAGNLCADTEGRVVFLDFGICGHLSDQARSALLVALPALLGRDLRTVAAAMFSTIRGADIDLDAITADLERVVLPMFDQPLHEVSYAQVFVEVVRTGVRHRVLLPRDLILVFKQFFYVERFSRLLAPDWMPLLDPDLMASVNLALDRNPPAPNAAS